MHQHNEPITNHKTNLHKALTMETTFVVTDQDVVKDEPIILISPKNPLPQQTIFLSNVDQAVAFPVETLFFFQVQEDKTSLTSDISDRIKKAVYEILVPYYFMAGRINFNHKSDRLELVCNNAGVAFVSAKSRLMVGDLGDLSLPNLTFGHFIHRPGIYKSLTETPLFTIQVTKFKCGGFSIGLLTNHGILDGKSAGEMFLNLASTCRGEGLKVPVLHNSRTSLEARSPPMIKFNHTEYIMLPKISSLATSFTTPYESSPSPLVFAKKYSYDHKLFKFNAKMINRLKAKTIRQCSSFEAIVGHIWRTRTRAVFDDPNDFSTVLFAMDIRSIISPPLPNGFVGNAVVTAYATSKVADLVEKPISFSVNLVKEGKKRITEEYVRSAIDWLEIYNGVPNTRNGNFYVSAWGKLPFGDLDFGFGKPMHGGPVVSGNDEFVLLLSEGYGGINVWMSLEHEKMNKFMAHVFDI